MNMKDICIICFAAAALLLQGCGNAQEKQQNSPVPFPQVSVPSYITDSQQATNWITRNFWDKFFALSQNCSGAGAQASGNLAANSTNGNLSGKCNSINGVDSLSFENAFGMYVQLLAMADTKSTTASINELFAKADSLALQGNRKPLLAFMARMEHYFYNPVSPVLDEEIYLCALNGILAAKSLTETEKMQYEYQHRICSMNRVGTLAADFSFRQPVSEKNALQLLSNNLSAPDSMEKMFAPTAPEGFADKSLYKDVKGEYTLLFFNNPHCNSCTEILDAIKTSPLGIMVQQGKLNILAMYIDENLTAWQESRSKFPDSWIYAYDPALVLRENNIYGLRAIPSLYLLDKEKRVLLKDAPVYKVIEYFN